jgi:YhcH/YjgK/YiaL family protein
MLIDHLSNASKYYGVSPYVAAALKWLEANKDKFATMENGQYEIDGTNVYGIVNSYDTKPIGDCGWEAHLKYCDIHYSVSGSERIGYQYKSHMLEIQEYNHEKDYALYAGAGDWITVREGSFCLLLPDDIHAPGAIAGEHPAHLKKVVIKLLAH